MLVTRVLVPAVLVVPLYVMASATGTQDTLTILVLTYTAINLPLAIWLLSPVLGSRATDQEEAAQIDGASHVCILFSVVLPMVRSALTATGLIIFLMCWNEYLFAAHLATDQAQTLPPWAVGQLSMKEAQVGGGAEELAHLSAATILMILPVLAFAALVQKQLGRSVLWRRD
jgi:multiple sugar transport system permease protein